VSRRILSATQTEKNSIQEVIDTISHINSSAQRQALESDGLRILAEKNRQILDELQSVLQTLLESRQSKVQI
jgi:very-short-patch-repair endonuclease